MIIITTGFIEDGVLTLNNRKAFEEEYLKLNGRVEIEIRPLVKTRTNKQNRYYWGVVMKIMKDYYDGYGNTYTQKEIHELLKIQCGLTKMLLNPRTGEATQITMSLSNLGGISTEEFSNYIDKIRAEYPEVNIPAPNEE